MKNWQKIYYFIDWVHNNIVHSASALCMCSSVVAFQYTFLLWQTSVIDNKKNASVKRRKLRSNDKSAYHHNNNSSVINKLITWPGRATFFECCIRWVPIHRVWDFNLKLKLTQQIIKWVNWNYFCVCFFDYVFSKFFCIKRVRVLGKQSEVYWIQIISIGIGPN